MKKVQVSESLLTLLQVRSAGAKQHPSKAAAWPWCGRYLHKCKASRALLQRGKHLTDSGQAADDIAAIQAAWIKDQ